MRSAFSVVQQLCYSVCARKYLFPSCTFDTDIQDVSPERLPEFEQLPTSKYFFCLGDHASTSTDFTFRSARSPEQHSSVRTGISSATEQIYCILPQFIIPVHAVFRFTYNDHFLFFKLVNTVHTSLFDTMCSFFFTETWRISWSVSSEALLHRVMCINKFTDHRMFTCTDQIQILSFNLVHHRIHLCKAHNSCYYITSDHEWRNAVSKSSVDHKISRIRNHCRMKSCNISHQIIEIHFLLLFLHFPDQFH